jgi:hypothetical protein
MQPDQVKVYKAIDEILWKEWDPIGINEFEGARDEYQMYLPKAYRLKQENANQETIAQYLFNIEVDRMGLFGNIDNCKRVANLILAYQAEQSDV